MRIFNKKSFTSMLLLFVFTLALAIPASAADQNYVFYNPSSGTTSHASTAITGPAVVTGAPGNYTVTLTLKNEGSYMGVSLPASYEFLRADINGAPSGDGTYEVTAVRSVSGNTTTFTFSGLANSTFDVPVQLQTTVAGIHSAVYNLVIDWQ